MAVLTFLGDVFLPAAYRTEVEFGSPFVFNLECPITSATVGWPGKVNLRAPVSHIEETFGEVPLAVCLANNHIMDYGLAGFDDTLSALRRAGIPSFGAGPLETNAGNPLLIPDHGVALLGYACPSTAAVLATEANAGAAPLYLARICRDVCAAKKAGARRVVVSLHWGEEEVFLPKPEDVVNARRIIDAGADLVIGHHAHCVQPFERYRDRFIFYGLGNCIMPNLNEPSYYDEQGRSTRRFVKTQHRWNRRSLAVTYDGETQAVTLRVLEFDGGTLRAARIDPARYRIAITDADRHALRYRRAFSYGKLRTKVMTYVSNPRRPRARHLKSLLAIAREVTDARHGEHR